MGLRGLCLEFFIHLISKCHFPAYNSNHPSVNSLSQLVPFTVAVDLTLTHTAGEMGYERQTESVL